MAAVILTPRAPLTDAGRAALAADGIVVQRPVTGGRYVALAEQHLRVVLRWTDPEIAFLANDPIAASARRSTCRSSTRRAT